MRYVSIAAAVMVCLLASVSQAAQVQCQAGDWTSGGSWTATLTASNANTLGVAAFLYAGGTTTDLPATGITDGSGNTYTCPAGATVTANVLGATERLRMCYAKNITGGALTITATTDGAQSVAVGRTVVCEFSGRDTTSPLDQVAAQAQNTPGLGSDDVSSGNVTTTASGEDLFAATMYQTGTGTIAAGTNYTAGATNTQTATEYRNNVAAGTYAGTFGAQFGDLVNFFTGVMTFKAQSATSSPRRGRTL